MVGTDAGRLFLCGSDGHVYEFDYDLDGGRWSKGKCLRRKARKVDLSSPSLLHAFLPSFLSLLIHGAADPVRDLAVDESRACRYLFTLHDSGAVQCFSLGVGGDAATLLWKKSQAEVRKNYHHPHHQHHQHF